MTMQQLDINLKARVYRMLHSTMRAHNHNGLGRHNRFYRMNFYRKC